MKKFGNYFLTFFIILFGCCLIIFANSNIVAVHGSVDLFLNAIFPSLFPFLIVSELLSHTCLISFLSLKFERIMKPIFNVPGIGSYPLILGLISGYPVGAKIVSNLRINNQLSKSDAEKLLIFTNNAGPLFIIGTVGCSIYFNSTIGFLLLLVHLISSITTGIIFGNFYKFPYRNSSNNSISSELSFSSLGEIISNSIKKSFQTLSIVCGFVVLFSLIISIIQISGILAFLNNEWLSYLILGLLEITSGINLISTISSSNLFWNLVITAFLLGNGGISVLLQVWSIISKTDLSIKPYVFGKIFNAFLSAIIMAILLIIFPFFQFSI